MKDKIIILLMCSIVITLNSQSNKHVSNPNSFNYDKWIASLTAQFDTLSKYDKNDFTHERLKNEITYVNNKKFSDMLGTSLQKNELKQWRNAVYIYQYFEGEVNFSLSTFIFYSGKKCWGITYDHSKSKFSLIVKKPHSKIFNLKSKMCWGTD